MMYVVYFQSTGEAFSFGTIVADPLDSQFDCRPLSEIEEALLASGTGIWNPVTLAMEPMNV